MAMRTFTAISMLAGLMLLAPASFARGRGGGGHSSSHGGSSFSSGHASSSFSGGHASSSFSGGHASSSFSGGHASSSFSGGHASFRGNESSGSSHGSGSTYAFGGHVSLADGGGHSNTVYGDSNAGYASTSYSTHPAIMHTMHHGHADPVGGGPVTVAGRVRGHNPSFMVRGEAVGSWTPLYLFRVPGIYRAYFTPYTTYADETYWMTDWVITDTLVGEEIAMEGPSDLGAPPMDAAVKEELREEIVADLLAPEETEASPDDPRIAAALANSSHIFLVSKDLAVQNEKGFACALRAADLVRPLALVAKDDRTVSVVVLAAKGGECAPGSHVTLTGADLAGFERDLLTRVDHARAAVEEGDAAPQPQL